MKALSLWQPWASLMAAGLKTIETRHWPTGCRGPLAIHAAKRDLWAKENDLLEEWAKEGLIGWDWLDGRFPLGAIVAIVELVDCTPTGYIDPGLPEVKFGNYVLGRWAWITKNPRMIYPPIPWRGRQGLFEIPDSVFTGKE